METDFAEKKKYQMLNSGDEIDEILKGLQSEGLDSTQAIIDDIKDLIVQRETLSSQVSSQLESVKMALGGFLQSLGPEVSVREKIELKKKEIEIEEDKIKERIDSWKDVALLKRELRIHTADFSDKVNKMNMLSDLMKD